jgi:hypothetical protein
MAASNRSNRKKKPQSFPEETLAAAYAAEHQPSYSHKWATLGAADASLVRQALLRANAIRQAGLDPGDAYLQGFIDMHYCRQRQTLVGDLRQTLAGAPEVDPSA